MSVWAKRALGGVAAALLVAAFLLGSEWVASAAAAALLHPMRRPVRGQPPRACRATDFAGAGVTLKGWRCDAIGSRRATLIFLHGVADNRTSVEGTLDRFLSRGFDVIAYDSRAQGESGGDVCTYGYWEKHDLVRVIDRLSPGPVVLLGTSLGAGVAIQAAAIDSRVSGIVAAEVFSDLRTVATERAPSFLTADMIRKAFSIAERRGRFRVDDVSPVKAAASIHVPVLLIHGTLDRDTPPEHSHRVFSAPAGPRELLLVPGAHHNESLRFIQPWQRIESWVDELVPRSAPR